MDINLHEALTLLGVDELKDLTHHFLSLSASGSKAELVASIANALLETFELQSIWYSLDANQKLAVSEAVYHPKGAYVHGIFQAKYQCSPSFLQVQGKMRGRGLTKSTPLCLLIYLTRDSGYGIPVDLRERLIKFVPEPEQVQISTSTEPDEAKGVVTRLTEREALQELVAMLHTIERERITVGEKTAVPSAASLRLLSESLPGGDFYPLTEKKDKYDQVIGPIKAFAWPMLLQAGGLAARTGTRLALSPAGIKALNAASADTIRSLWRKWLKSNLLDEFSRIESIKGQNSTGRVMSAVAPRRAVIEEALEECPVGEWIQLQEFSRFMRASSLIFTVAHDFGKLYISERQYGNLAYAGSNGWNILQHRYILALLFEYAATLGMVDVVYADPSDSNNIPRDFRGMWGTDELKFLSQYDGLIQFRLTALGAYVLGLMPTYQALSTVSTVSTVTLMVTSGLMVGVADGSLNADAILMLDTWAQALPDRVWRLDHQKALLALEKGHDIGELKKFLEDHTPAPLPDTVTELITNTQRDAKAVKTGATAMLLECRDAQTAQKIAEHKATGSLCLQAGPKTLVVRTEQLVKFREALRQLGLGLGA